MTPTLANEINYRNGPDIVLSDAYDAEFIEDAPETDEDERLECEGRREMYETLFGEGCHV